jgi:hypothetical protein
MDPREIKYTLQISASYRGIQFERQTYTMSTPVSQAMQNAQEASTNLTAGVATYIADTATALKNALAGNGSTGNSDADVQALADQMTADAASLAASDPITNPAGSTTPVTPPVQQVANPAGQ